MGIIYSSKALTTAQARARISKFLSKHKASAQVYEAWILLSINVGTEDNEDITINGSSTPL